MILLSGLGTVGYRQTVVSPSRFCSSGSVGSVGCVGSRGCVLVVRCTVEDCSPLWTDGVGSVSNALIILIILLLYC